MEFESFLAAALELLALPSTADRPDDLQRALDFVLDWVGPGFTVERFSSGGKPSALVYSGAGTADGAGRPRFRVILNAHLDVVPAGPEQFVPRRDGDRLYARGAQDMKMAALVEALVFRELAIARIETSNHARNQIPAQAQAWADIRFPPEDGDFNGKTAAEITAHLASFCEPGVTPVVEMADPAHHADRQRPEVRALARAATDQGYNADFLRKHGAADGRFYYQRGIDAVIFGIGGDGLHGPDEYADLTTIIPYYQALTEFLGTPT